MLPQYGNWKVVRRIGKGSFGTVYEIEQEDALGFSTKSALKVMFIPQSEEAIDELRREGEAETRVKEYFYEMAQGVMEEVRLMYELKGHANIVTYLDHEVRLCEDGISRKILVRMELLESLPQYIKRHKMTKTEVICLGIDICSALERCQQFQIIHRDIKPGNILVAEDGTYKLSDFGIARRISQEGSAGSLSQKGTYSYMAPEVYLGKSYDYRVDMYSLGIVLYQLLNDNRDPFLPAYPEKITLNRRKEALRCRMEGRKLPYPSNETGALGKIILKACSYKATERYSSPAEMREALEAILPFYQSKEHSVNGEKEFSDREEEVFLPGREHFLQKNDDEEEKTKWQENPFLESDGTVSAEGVDDDKTKKIKEVYTEKKQKKRRMFQITAILMVLLLIARGIFYTYMFTEVTSSTGDFYYAAEEVSSEDYKTTYYYEDRYFEQSAYTYQDSLATMSLCMSMASGRSNRTRDYAKKTQNLKDLLKKCGFRHFAANEGYTTKPTKDSTGVACASKKVIVDGKEYTLIALVICGARFEAEWGGSFEMGASGNLKNAESGAEEALRFLQDYIADQKIQGSVKLWINGYSIGAGKANLLASKLDDGISPGNNILLKREDIYTYCFQTSKIATLSNDLDAEKYQNIFTVNNPYAPSTHMAPEAYKFGVFGVVKNLPTANTDPAYSEKRDDMLEQLEQIDGTSEYLVDQFQPKRISLFGAGMIDNDVSCQKDQAAYMEMLIDAVADTCALTREDYARDFQDDICELLDLIFGSPDENWTDCMNVFCENIQKHLLDVGIQMILRNQNTLAGMIREYADDALQKAGVSTYSSDDVERLANALSKLAIKFAVNHIDMTITLFNNLPSLFQANYAPYTLAWLRAADVNYTEK